VYAACRTRAPSVLPNPAHLGRCTRSGGRHAPLSSDCPPRQTRATIPFASGCAQPRKESRSLHDLPGSVQPGKETHSWGNRATRTRKLDRVQDDCCLESRVGSHVVLALSGPSEDPTSAKLRTCSAARRKPAHLRLLRKNHALLALAAVPQHEPAAAHHRFTNGGGAGPQRCGTPPRPPPRRASPRSGGPRPRSGTTPCRGP